VTKIIFAAAIVLRKSYDLISVDDCRLHRLL
jgi:hypothetical protein